MAKVLLLEDDADLTSKMAQYLSAHNHIVECVLAGDEAWMHLQAYGYDVLIVDWNVRGLNGHDLCLKYRSTGGDLPILMITGKTELAALESAFAAGVDDYLRKPFTAQELLCRMMAVLRRRPVPKEQISRIGNLSFDHDSREAFVDNGPVALQPQESAILSYLLRNNTWATAVELAERAKEECTTIEAVRTSVMNLRKKLAAAGSTATIETSRGQGYIISNESRLQQQ